MSAFGKKGYPNLSQFTDASTAVHWTSMRLELLEWFKRKAPSLAPAYEGAVRLLYTPGFPGRIHLFCHVVRDIYNFLPQILDGVTRINIGEAYPSLIKKLEQHWPSDRMSFVDFDDVPDGSIQETLTISRQVYQIIDELVAKSRHITSQPTTGEHLSRILYRENPTDNVHIPMRLIEEFNNTRRWFVSRAHLVTTMEKLPAEDSLIEQFETFEKTLFSFVGQYFSGTRELDDILQQTNEQVD